MSDIRFEELMKKFGGKGIPTRVTATSIATTPDQLAAIGEWARAAIEAGWEVKIEIGDKVN